MALQFITGNRLEDLAGRLAEHLRNRPEGIGALAGETVAVVNPGNAKWLTHELARRMGVCVNVEFVTRGGFWNRVIPGMAEASQNYDPKVMAWRIVRLLETEGDSFPELRSYLRDYSGITRAMYSIANEVAGVFDVYQVYRADVLRDWSGGGKYASDGGVVESFVHSAWQKALWSRLRGDTAAESPAELFCKFLSGELDAEARGLVEAAFPARRVFVFGIGTMPPMHVDLYRKLACMVDVVFFHLNPSQEFWGDATTERRALWMRRRGDVTAEAVGNQLLAALASSGKSLFNKLLDIEEYGNAEELWQGGDSATVLGEMQNAVLENRVADLGGREPDDSVCIHICHSEMREMEALRDDVLRWLDPKLNGGERIAPHDMVVMAPNISKYAPAIEAVFGQWNREHPESRIQYSVTDRTHAEESQVANAFTMLMRQGRSRMKFGEFRELLSFRTIWAGLGVDELKRDDVLEILYRSGVRWGWDAQHRERFSGVEFDEYSWTSGLLRLAVEYSTGRIDLVPGDALGRALGALADLAMRVNALGENLRKAHTADEWRVLLLGIVDRFLSVDNQAKRDELTLRKAIAEFGDTCTAAGCGGLKLPCEVVEAYMDAALWSVADTGGFMTRGITFCRLQPLRNIPAKYVWIAGLNDDEYPRRDKRHSFDLRLGCPREGDRSDRDDDCQLLIDALLSARRALRLSYKGSDAKDNTRVPPGVVLNAIRSELLEAFGIRGGKVASGDSEAGFELRHRLHHFSPDYFNPEGKWHDESAMRLWMNLSQDDYEDSCTFAKANAVVGAAAVFRSGATGGFIEELKPGRYADCRFLSRQDYVVADLVKFWGAPAQTWLAAVMGIWEGKSGKEYEDNEPMSFDALDKWNVGDVLLNMFTEDIRGAFGEMDVGEWTASNDVEQELFRRLRDDGIMPVGERGVGLVRKAARERAGSLETLRGEMKGWTPLGRNARVALDIGGRALSGEIGSLYAKGNKVRILKAKAGALTLADCMELAVLNALLPLSDLAAGEMEFAPSVVTSLKDNDKIVSPRLEAKPLGRSEADAVAKMYFADMLAAIGGCSEPLLLVARKTALACAFSIDDAGSTNEDAVRSAWDGNYNVEGDGAKSCNNLMFGSEFPGHLLQGMAGACRKYILDVGISDCANDRGAEQGGEGESA